MLRAIIIDDEENSSNALKEKLHHYFPEVQVISICSSAEQGIAAINSLKPDMIFLDIEMPRMNGFAMLQQVTNRNFEIVFITAYDHYAIKAIRFSALDYLVKPVEIEELGQAIQRAEEKRKESLSNERLSLLLDNLGQTTNHRQRIAVPTLSGLEFLKVDTIVYLEASINYTHIFLKDGRKYIVSRTMKEFEDLLPTEIFIRIHHSHIINKNFAARYIRGDGGQVVLSNGVVLDIAKRRKAEFLKLIDS